MRRPWRREEPKPSRADEELARSRERLEEVRQQRRGWDELATKLREIRERNHLGEAIETALREGR